MSFKRAALAPRWRLDRCRRPNPIAVLCTALLLLACVSSGVYAAEADRSVVAAVAGSALVVSVTGFRRPLGVWPALLGVVVVLEGLAWGEGSTAQQAVAVASICAAAVVVTGFLNDR